MTIYQTPDGRLFSERGAVCRMVAVDDIGGIHWGYWAGNQKARLKSKIRYSIASVWDRWAVSKLTSMNIRARRIKTGEDSGIGIGEANRKRRNPRATWEDWQESAFNQCKNRWHKSLAAERRSKWSAWAGRKAMGVYKRSKQRD